MWQIPASCLLFIFLFEEMKKKEENYLREINGNREKLKKTLDRHGKAKSDQGHNNDDNT